MPEDVFRIFVAVAVALAALAFIVQAIVGMATLRAARAVQQRIESLASRVEPVIDRAGPTIEKVGPLLDKAGPAIEKIGPTLEKVGPVIEKFGPVADKMAVLIATGQQVLEETRPKVAEISSEVIQIARTGKQQVERLGDLLTDAGDRARSRLEQIDHAVESTVEKVEQVGQNVKRTMTRPVREVNSVAAAISAAVSALVKGPRRSNVNSATQDEELFI